MAVVQILRLLWIDVAMGELQRWKFVGGGVAYYIKLYYNINNINNFFIRQHNNKRIVFAILLTVYFISQP